VPFAAKVPTPWVRRRAPRRGALRRTHRPGHLRTAERAGQHEEGPRVRGHQLAPLLATRLAIVGIFGFGDREGVRDEPQAAHALSPLLCVLAERVRLQSSPRNTSRTVRASRIAIESPWPMIGLL
jgi:hypothetical protein